MDAQLSWNSDGNRWPNRDTSRFVDSGPTRWHVQISGHGPCVLMLHGTGAATHSWAGLSPLLSQALTVVAPDLPGHGFTSVPRPSRLSLPDMAKALTDLCATLEIAPELIVGHSAGAAIGAHMAISGQASPAWIVSLNGALLPLTGLPGSIFSPLARLLARSTIVPWLFSLRASDRRVVERLIRETGSRIGREGIDHYAMLARNARHVRGALEMMANWDLRPLQRDLGKLKSGLLLLASSRDRTVSPYYSREAAKLAPHAVFRSLPGLGHLAHEERPDLVAEHILGLANSGKAEG